MQQQRGTTADCVPGCPVTKWVSNVAMQVTSKNNHKKFGNIWGCFRVKYRTRTTGYSGRKAEITTAFHAPIRRKCRSGPPDGAPGLQTFHAAIETTGIRRFSAG
ncbi:hypothetical protein [Burkholderia ambifaria]|uniref:hypothetical protein n=1 Tax=Burkholderia ambifaria TaxID=152480 RepID=UPI00158C86B7|nr:hypothetical protein [Burkholderia ambifaria]